MSSHRIHKRRSLPALIAAIAFAGASVFLIAAPASAHDELVSADPAAGAAVDALPAQLTLTFSGELATDPGATELQVTDAAGTSLANGDPVVADTTVTQPLAGTASGAITVLWKVVSSDGHPISGEYTFTVTAPAPTPTPTPTPSATVSSAPTESPSATESAAPVTDEDADADGSWPWIVGAILLVAIAGAVTYLLVSSARRKRALEAATTLPPAPSDEGSPGSTDR